MKIELGPNSKILGTKKVSAKGQISGLSEAAGSEVMVILIGEEPQSDYGDLPHEILYKQIQRNVEAQMTKAFQNYKKLNETFATPGDATREYMRKMGDELTDRLKADLNKWLANFIQKK